MKEEQLQKHLSSNFSENLILAQVQNHPAGDVTRVSAVSIKMTVKINEWRGRRLFICIFVLSVAVEIYYITPCEESSVIQLIELTHICLVAFSPGPFHLDEFISNFSGVWCTFYFIFDRHSC